MSLSVIRCHQWPTKKEKTMARNPNSPETLQDVRQVAGAAVPAGRRAWIGRAATERVCEMAGVAPASVASEAPGIRALLGKVRPAAHGMSKKTWTNLLSRFRVELRFAGIIEPNYAGSAA